MTFFDFSRDMANGSVLCSVGKGRVPLSFFFFVPPFVLLDNSKNKFFFEGSFLGHISDSGSFCRFPCLRRGLAGG